MAVNSVSSESVKEVNFPFLMADNYGRIYLMTETTVGTIVKDMGANENLHRVGYYSTNWDAPSLTPFTGSITLSNE